MVRNDRTYSKLLVDERYGHSVSSLSPLFRGGTLMRPNGCCYDQHSAGRLHFYSRSWSLTASYSTGPQIRNRWTAIAAEDSKGIPELGSIGRRIVGQENSYPARGRLGTLLSAPPDDLQDHTAAPRLSSLNSLQYRDRREKKRPGMLRMNLWSAQ